MKATVAGRAFRFVAFGWAVLGWAAVGRPEPRFPGELFAVSDLVRVFEDGYGLPKQRPTKIDLFAVRGETVSGQVVLHASRDLTDVRVSVTPLKSDDGRVLPEQLVTTNFVDSVYVEKNTPKLVSTDLVRAAPAWFPDVLSDKPTGSVAKGRYKAVYLTVRVPRDALPGRYVGRVSVSAGGATSSLPLQLTVYPLTLPESRHLFVTEWFSSSRFKHHGGDWRDEQHFYRLLQAYARNMADHRQNVFRVPLELVSATADQDGRLHFDFSRFDRWAETFWSTGRMDLLETGFVARFAHGGWSSREIVLRDFTVTDAATGKTHRLPGDQFWPQFLPALVQHLKEKRWLEKTVLHIADEPSHHNVLSWRKASQFAHRYAPELRRIDAIETPHCGNDLEIWVPKLDHLATWYEAYDRARRRGAELWFYTVGIYQKGSLPNKTLDVALIESRLLEWLAVRYRLKGYLHWGFNAWTDDPFRDAGKHRGDGWLVYPARNGLLNSLRWEQMRNGLQDAECLWLLENELRMLQRRLPAAAAEMLDPTQRPVEIATHVIQSFHQFSRDPQVLYRARRLALDELVQLRQPPGLVVETEPPELTAVANDCAVDVHGWVEPGSEVRVNGRPVPVHPDGVFLYATAPSDDGTITVEATKDGQTKTTVRRFRLLY